MSRYPAIMKIEQCEPESTFLDDVSKLITFVRTHDNSFAEYVRVARMYLFGTPIRRKGAGFRHATPGCETVPLRITARAGGYAHRVMHPHALTDASD
jgi:hypothetical protein